MSIFAKHSLGIDITQDRIDMVLLKKTDSGIQLLKSASADMPEGVISNGNVTDPAALAKLIKQLKSSNRIKANFTTISLIANPSLMQIMEIPEKMPENIFEYIRGELKHYATLPMNNTAVDFCRLPSTTAQNKALIGAADSKKLNELVNKLNYYSVNITAIEPPQLAYFRASSKSLFATEEVKNKLHVFIHGSTLSLSVFTSAALDMLKTKQLKDKFSSSDENTVLLTKEINTLIKYYEIEQSLNPKDWQIIIYTDSAEAQFNQKINNIKEQLSCENLVVKTALDPFEDGNIKISGGQEHSVVAMGLALKPLEERLNFSINLLPKYVSRKKAAKKQTLMIANIAAVILLTMFLSACYTNLQKSKFDKSLKLKDHSKIKAQTKYLTKKEEMLDNQIEDTSARIENLKAILSSQQLLNWSNIFENISSSIPKNIRIARLTSNAAKGFTIQGHALSYQDIYLFVDILRDSEYLGNVIVRESKVDPSIDDMFKYTIDCVVIN